MKKFIITLRVFLWLALIIIADWLLYKGIVPSGKTSYATDFSRPNFFIGKLTPTERIKTPDAEAGSGTQIIGDPVYFSLRTLRKFDKAKLFLKYKTDDAPPVIEAGVLADKTIWRYNLQPIENKIIDQLVLVWDVKKENGLILLQRNNSASTTLYGSIEDFLNKPPQNSEIALYNYDLNAEYLLPDYQKSAENQPAVPALRGVCQFYTYIKEEDLDFTFDFIDINKNKDEDPVDLNLYFNNQIIDTRHLDDDGIAVNSGKESATRQINLKTAGLPEGVYKIELRANDDIITEEITTKQNKLAFINKIWLVGNGAADIDLFTDSNKISAQTVNPGNLQIIKVGEKALNINQTYKQFNIEAEQGVKEVKLEKDDVILAGDGVFSFSQDGILNPGYKKVNGALDVNKINYILARYEPPREEGGWRMAQAEFDLTKTYREDGKYSFLISIPGLKIDDGVDDGVEIGEIKIELDGTALLKKIKNIFANQN